MHEESWVYLSHVMAPNTPGYGGSTPLNVIPTKSIEAGDSCNEGAVCFPLHLGTHVDAPRHFDDHGLSIEKFEASMWHVTRAHLVDVPTGPRGVVDLDRFQGRHHLIPEDCELLLIRTGSESDRDVEPDTYSCEGPCLGDDLARWLRESRQLKFVGIDAISISSLANREIGRRTHRELLLGSSSPPVLVIEDMHLSELSVAPLEVWVLPLRIKSGDGAAATVVARIA